MWTQDLATAKVEKPAFARFSDAMRVVSSGGPIVVRVNTKTQRFDDVFTGFDGDRVVFKKQTVSFGNIVSLSLILSNTVEEHVPPMPADVVKAEENYAQSKMRAKRLTPKKTAKPAQCAKLAMNTKLRCKSHAVPGSKHCWHHQ